ncbi:hypothetical protein FB192DRAFT_1088434 [Mucor lusitanicus]|uniref:C2H2-type domain-containing protein n=1 Tax=Mucor circinelloides f. lusitanicus TaxID=29924 RepID=A0A8H4BL81_MUCCL|nr:hypothetical protein FB192DRAFT_1088434 [Mucor lusitanicus]
MISCKNCEISPTIRLSLQASSWQLRIFATVNSVSFQMQKSLTKDTGRCEINGCGKHFFRRYEFLNHVQAKHALIPFVCPVEGCGEEFAFPSGLVTHRRLVHGSEPAFYCQHCQAPFESRDRLEDHLNRTHNLSSCTENCHIRQ